MERGKSRSISDCSPRPLHRVHSVDGNVCDLPDSILSYILSFLPTNNAVATSILSQRWKSLWTMTNNLDFEYNRDDGVDRFVKYVNYVLRLHNPGFLNGFTLSWKPGCTGCMPFYVDIWISTAIDRNVCKLNLDLGISGFPIHVQSSIFSCESLQSLALKVTNNFYISQEIAFSLPKLETLELELVIFESEETLCQLLAGCPVLKSLSLTIDISKTIENCHLDDEIAFKCIISSASLRRLVLFADDVDRDECYMSICGVQLDAPLLECVKLYWISSISVRQTPIYLVEAYIELWKPQYEEQDHEKYVVEAFCAFECAQKLVLNFGVIKAFMNATIEMKPIFNKLTRLEMTKDFICWIELHYFLQWLGNLEVLIVKKECGDIFDSELEENLVAVNPDLVPRCLANTLRLVAIDNYDDDEDGFVMISYILKHASVLKHMAILVCCYGLEKKSEVIQKISKLPRKSPVCEVDFTKDAWHRISKS